MSDTTEFAYPVSTRALEKWRHNNLELLDLSGAVHHYRFIFSGSTCNNGGTPFQAYLHTLIDISRTDPVVQNAWVEIPPHELDGAREMCEYRTVGDAFIKNLAEPPEFCGRSLSEIISENVELNHAGCFCTQPMINQKWRMALSTVHFAIFQAN